MWAFDATNPSGSATMSKRLDPRPIAILSTGHLVVDLYQGAIPALLPIWKQLFALPYAATGAMMLALQLSSSVVQPLFGLLGDRFRRGYLLPLALLVAGGGVSAAVLAGSYAGALAGIVIGGLGVALYHPEGSRRAHERGGNLRATAMSWFSVGGNLGLGLGPLVTAVLLQRGLGALAAGLAGIGLAAALVLAAGRPLVTGERETAASPAGPSDDSPPGGSSPASSGQRGGDPASRVPGAAGARMPGASGARMPGAPASRTPDRWGALALLAAVVVMRSWTHASVQAFVPLLLTESGMPTARAQALLAVFLLAGPVGTLIGGPLADAIGRKPVMVWSMAATVPLMWLLGHASGPFLPAVLAASGFVLISTFSVSIVLAQELLPNRIGTASGIVLGASVGTGGIGVALLGWLADAWGLRAAVSTLALMPLAGLLLAAFLPAERRQPLPHRASVAAR